MACIGLSKTDLDWDNISVSSRLHVWLDKAEIFLDVLSASARINETNALIHIITSFNICPLYSTRCDACRRIVGTSCFPFTYYQKVKHVPKDTGWFELDLHLSQIRASMDELLDITGR